MNFEKLACSIKDKLYRFSLRITNDVAEAEDVVQEVFLKVWQRREEMSDIQNQEAWCMTLTRNLSLDKIKSKHRRTEEIGEALQLKDSLSTPYAATQSADTIGKIRTLMQQLPENQRLVMHLRDIEDLTYDEIADTLDMPLAQVKINLHRARTKIRAAFLEEDGFLNLE